MRMMCRLLCVSVVVAMAGALWWSASERARVERNYRTVVAENGVLRSQVRAGERSVERLRMRVGELEEFRREEVERVRLMGISLRHVQSLTRLESQMRVDTVVRSGENGGDAFRPLLSDSLCRLRWRDSWVSLEAEVRGGSTRLEITSCDTLFQVVHRVPWRWWIFSWGTKAVRQEIRSSNPHTRLVYAEYLELER